MSSRIRYVSVASDTNICLESHQEFTGSGGVQYKVFLYPSEGTWEVKSNATTVVASGNGSGPAALKTAAKKALKTLGVSFSSETRKTSSPTEAA